MTERTILCCLEERSAQEMLSALLPKLLPQGWSVQFITFEGKTDLRNRLHMDVTGSNKSRSFNALVAAIRELTRGV